MFPLGPPSRSQCLWASSSVGACFEGHPRGLTPSYRFQSCCHLDLIGDMRQLDWEGEPPQCYPPVPGFGTRNRRGRMQSQSPWRCPLSPEWKAEVDGKRQKSVSSGSMAPILFQVKFVLFSLLLGSLDSNSQIKSVKPKTIPLTHNSNSLKEWMVCKILMHCIYLSICLFKKWMHIVTKSKVWMEETKHISWG